MCNQPCQTPSTQVQQEESKAGVLAVRPSLCITTPAFAPIIPAPCSFATEPIQRTSTWHTCVCCQLMRNHLHLLLSRQAPHRDGMCLTQPAYPSLHSHTSQSSECCALQIWTMCSTTAAAACLPCNGQQAPIKQAPPTSSCSSCRRGASSSWRPRRQRPLRSSWRPRPQAPPRRHRRPRRPPHQPRRPRLRLQLRQL